MLKLFKTRKKSKGIEEKIKRLEFYNALKNPPMPEPTAQDFLEGTRQRRSGSRTNPYNSGAGGAADKLLNKIRQRAGIK